MSPQAEEEALFYHTWNKIGKTKQRPSRIDFIPDDDPSRSTTAPNNSFLPSLNYLTANISRSP
ncbi:hypothetical protein FB107DRAFT_269979 [Schizophyllum commune]